MQLSPMSQPCQIRFKLHATAGLRKQQWWALSRAKWGAWKWNTEIEYRHLRKKPRFFCSSHQPTVEITSSVLPSVVQNTPSHPLPRLPHSRWGLCRDNNCSHSSFVTLRRLFFFSSRPLSQISQPVTLGCSLEREPLLFTSFSKKR